MVFLNTRVSIALASSGAIQLGVALMFILITSITYLSSQYMETCQYKKHLSTRNTVLIVQCFYNGVIYGSAQCFHRGIFFITKKTFFYRLIALAILVNWLEMFNCTTTIIRTETMFYNSAVNTFHQGQQFSELPSEADNAISSLKCYCFLIGIKVQRALLFIQQQLYYIAVCIHFLCDCVLHKSVVCS